MHAAVAAPGHQRSPAAPSHPRAQFAAPGHQRSPAAPSLMHAAVAAPSHQRSPAAPMTDYFGDLLRIYGCIVDMFDYDFFHTAAETNCHCYYEPYLADVEW
jgi:hypothetical protein